MDRNTMNKKPVIEVPAKSVINFESGFAKKLLCDGPTFSTGTACAYSCSFCYVPAIMKKSPHLKGVEDHSKVVIRRKGALEAMRNQLVGKKGDRYNDPKDQRVIYASPLVDVAANLELAQETVDACRLILDHTQWHIRLLSKSSMLSWVAEHMDRPDAKARMIFGFSTGEFNDHTAAAYEQGTAKVSRRLADLRKLQDGGWRTFGMICPSLPRFSYEDFSMAAFQVLRPALMEHVWAEVINVRGESMTRTVEALRKAGMDWVSKELKRVSMDPEAWEEYARKTFEAHLAAFGPKKLRYLQYVNKGNQEYWSQFDGKGAVLL